MECLILIPITAQSLHCSESMRPSGLLGLLVLLLLPFLSVAQQPFVEGYIRYKIHIETPEGKSFKGTYTFTFKDGYIKKELKLNSGYADVIVINSNNSTVYSLKNIAGKKYAIQLSMDEMQNRQMKYSGFKLETNDKDHKKLDGVDVVKGMVTFPDGSTSVIYFSPKWYPDKSITFEKYPNAHFMPLIFDLKDENGVSTYMEAEKISVNPVESAEFRVPSDYTIITNQEYKNLNKY